jgi:hypothetical protein
MKAARSFVLRLKARAKETNTPLAAEFHTPPRCRGLCLGYHPVEGLAYDPSEGQFYYLPSPFGFHSVRYPLPEPKPIPTEEAVALAHKLLAKARRVNPFAAYPRQARVWADEVFTAYVDL